MAKTRNRLGCPDPAPTVIERTSLFGNDFLVVRPDG